MHNILIQVYLYVCLPCPIGYTIKCTPRARKGKQNIQYMFICICKVEGEEIYIYIYIHAPSFFGLFSRREILSTTITLGSTCVHTPYIYSLYLNNETQGCINSCIYGGVGASRQSSLYFFIIFIFTPSIYIFIGIHFFFLPAILNSPPPHSF